MVGRNYAARESLSTTTRIVETERSPRLGHPRARAGAPVSAPVAWTELERISDPRDLNVSTVPERLTANGDPWQGLDDEHHSLDQLLDLWDSDPVEMNFPPTTRKCQASPRGCSRAGRWLRTGTKAVTHLS